MEILLNSLVLILGLVLLIKGAALLVEGAVSFAQYAQIPEIAIGLSLVALSTSLPEIVVSIISATRNESEVVFAGIIGSNIFNIYMVVGVMGLIRTIYVQKITALREIPFTLFSIILVFVLVNDQIFFNKIYNRLVRQEGLLLLGVFFIFIVLVFRKSKRTAALATQKEELLTKKKTAIYLILGLFGVGLGGHLAVEQVVNYTSYFVVSRKMVAILALSPALALPELTTALISSFKNRFDLAVGSIIGSCMFNLLLAFGISSTFTDLDYNHALNFDFYFFFFGVFLFFIGLFMGKKLRISRRQSAVFVLFLLAYIYFLFIRK